LTEVEGLARTITLANEADNCVADHSLLGKKLSTVILGNFEFWFLIDDHSETMLPARDEKPSTKRQGKWRRDECSAPNLRLQI
jgi:hypothetical protein